MKNILSLFALIACFTFLASSTATAQDAIGNYTDCDMTIKVGYGNVGNCNVTGYLQAVVPANSVINLGLASGEEIKIAKGRYNTATSCIFYVGQPLCSPYNLTDNVSCSSGCGAYSAYFVPAIGIKIYN